MGQGRRKSRGDAPKLREQVIKPTRIHIGCRGFGGCVSRCRSTMITSST
jgi:hypothetical protein